MLNWKKLFVESNLPQKLAPLKEISKNLWWSWNPEACDLFHTIDPEVWEESSHNPVVLLERVSYQRLTDLEEDEEFMERLGKVYKSLQDYLLERENCSGPRIAYFSMEYGIHDSLKIFSGGLGILAGDYLKEASDSRVNLIGVGLLYRYGYFKQTISIHGDQMANYEAEQFSKIPVQPAFDASGNWITVQVEYPGRIVRAQVWVVFVGAIKLYLLDTDFDGNSDEDRSITHHLYGGDNENRLKQEMLLGLGGIRALKQLGIESDIYHCNEGHAAMIGLERMLDYVENKGLGFHEAKEVVRASNLFTTHTPVPAGHDSFHQDMFFSYMNSIANRLKISWDEFVMLGKASPNEDHFNMSYLAANLSQNVNGVSKLHGDVTKEIFKQLYDGFLPEELEIGYVTNGVHFASWTATEWKSLYAKYLGKEFAENLSDLDLWDKIYKVPDDEIWNLKMGLKAKLFDYIKVRFENSWIQRNENPKLIGQVKEALQPKALTVGFARRFATYKRAHLLFRNLERLSAIVNDPERPVQFIFAGKAHPADKAGQDLIRYIVDISKRPEFIGKILFVQNYDINLAKYLVQGVDVWLNTPTRPLEASGTSGEKGVMNGTMHFSVLDGWWVEGYKEGAGWMLPEERAYDEQDLQDELDAETIYSTFEDEIIPAYYERNEKGIPESWIHYLKNTIAQVAPNFTTTRMINDYIRKFYNPQFDRSKQLLANGYAKAKEISAWKKHMVNFWNRIEVKEIQISDGITNVLKIGEKYPVTVILNLNGLAPEEVGVEIITTVTGPDGEPDLDERLEFLPVNKEGTLCTYQLDLHLNRPGAYNYGIRLFAKNKDLPNRQDFRLIRWI